MARTFNGTSDYGSVVLPLSAYSALSIYAACWWDTFSNNDDLLLEYSPNANSANAFFIDPNDSGGVFGFYLKDTGVAGFNSAFATRFSAGAWHRLLITMGRNGTSAQQIKGYLDGANWGLTQVGTAACASNFDNSTLYIMSRAGANLFGAGRLADMAIWGGVLLSEEEAVALTSGAVFPHNIRPERLINYEPMCGVDNPEPDYSPSNADMTLVGTTRSRHPVLNPLCLVSASFVPNSVFE